MRCLAAQVQKLLAENRTTAEAGCMQADLGRPHLSPRNLQIAQDGIRRQLLWVEHRLREVRERAARRDEMLRRRLGRHPPLRVLRQEHTALLRRRERALETQRSVLRQIGDALAWLVLNHDARIIVPLYAERTHALPQGVGLGGPVVLARKAHATEEFLVLENDLTRCLGIGDLTVVFARRPWRRPICVEVKAKGEWREGTELELDITSVYSTDDETQVLHDELCKQLGLRDPPADRRPRDVERQTAEQVSRAELLLATTEGATPRLEGPSRRVWRAIGHVLTRAHAEGLCWDLLSAES